MKPNEQLVDAVRKLDIEATQKAILNGADVNYIVPENAKKTLELNVPVLIVAIEGDMGVESFSKENKPEIIKALLEAGANPNVRNYEKETTLMLTWNSYSLAKLLLEYGANPNLRGNDNISTIGFIGNRIEGLENFGRNSDEARSVYRILKEYGAQH
ncbi:hypothetical protein BAQ48_00130 [Bacillus luti]|uniref:ankyrin repeat domain-containing protein n=1 Tax=Bacillus luti TaxID=2026191 RepID=UPI0008FE642B|nr:ankyrin repeat domain-containing protein [Bacillus luti]OJE52885.1 hypothetical protein BAQ48_00130 [Bacillus luti]